MRCPCAYPTRRLDHAHQGQGYSRLAGTGFANKTDPFIGLNNKADPAHCLNDLPCRSEGDRKVLYPEQAHIMPFAGAADWTTLPVPH